MESVHYLPTPVRPPDDIGWESFAGGWASISNDKLDIHINHALSFMPCLAGDPLCDKWVRAAIERSHGYGGSGSQMQRILAKLQGGEEVHVGVIGGSISACAEVKASECYPTRLEEQLSRIFKPYGTTFKVVRSLRFCSDLGGNFIYLPLR